MKNSIREARLEMSLTQQGLAELVHVSRQTIISIESRRYVPSTILTLKLAEALQTRVEALFELEKTD
jgi:putative transcriptional regulator